MGASSLTEQVLAEQQEMERLAASTGLVGGFQDIRGVVLIVSGKGTGTIERDDDESVGGDGLDVEDVVESGDERGVNIEEVADGDGGSCREGWIGR
ncbi:hypothetical protein F0562_001414 [Nyssa sinensis]|uniref:Uncharacterized protein n=1 Tax=Nyssa sinensis TaxID=561372 RepID=A0A5J5C2M4_9ASTE|nr:hypothetical protein F0562_001414 [Nyssa sinensis]